MCMAVSQRGHERSQGSRCNGSASAKRLALDGASSARATLRPAHEHFASRPFFTYFACFSKIKFFITPHSQSQAKAFLLAYVPFCLFAHEFGREMLSRHSVPKD